jgi:pimeloyl-ACP methyl ester carboxylesterase
MAVGRAYCLMIDDEYVVVRQSYTAQHRIAGVTYVVRMWGSEPAAPLVLLHGMRDTSVTFQFLVDSLEQDWWVIAPDWRGHGHTGPPGDYAWFHDYLADLDALLDAILPGRKVDLVGHSLGGNVATVYAALRPERVHRVIALDAFGLAEVRPQDYVQSLQTWLQHSAVAEAPQLTYETLEELAQRLCLANTRLSRPKARYLARHTSRRLADGQLTWQFHSRRIRSMPTLRRFDEWVECWRRIQAPALWVASSDPLPGSARANSESFDYLQSQIGRDRVVHLPDAGHNLHHDAPALLAGVIERFLRGTLSEAHVTGS